MYTLVFLTLLQTASLPVTQTPTHPRLGDTVTITYTPSPQTPLPAEAEVFELALGYTLYPGETVLPMQWQNGIWEVSFTLTDPEHAHVAYFFQADATRDTNDGAYWSFKVHDSNGEPLRGAWYQHGLFNAFRYAESIFLSDSVRAAYAQELVYHPGNFDAQVRLWAEQRALKADQAAFLEVAIDAIEARYPSPQDESTLQAKQRAYALLGLHDRADALRNQLIRTYPQGFEAELAMLFGSLYIGDVEVKQGRLEAFLQTFPNSSYRSAAYEDLFAYYRDHDNVGKMIEMGDLWIASEGIHVAEARNTYASALADRGLHLDKATRLADEAYHRANEDPFRRPTYRPDGWLQEVIPPAQRARIVRRRQATYRATQGWVMHQLDRPEKAARLLREADAMRPNDPTIQERLATVYESNQRANEALNVYTAMLERDATYLPARMGFARTFAQVHGKQSDVGSALNRIEQTWRTASSETALEERVGIPAPAFALEDLNGTPLHSSELRGKVVVLDFWATWCSPCLAAFPYLQEVYERYADHPHVVFLIINTSWVGDTAEAARSFFAEHPYTFPTAYDPDGKTTAQFDISSIPATFLIDPNGIIQYRHTSLGSGNAYVLALTAQIEALLASTENK